MSKAHARTLAITKNPLLIETDSDGAFLLAAMEAIESDAEFTQVRREDERAANDDDFWGNPQDPRDYRAYVRPYVVKDNVLQIPVRGMLLDKFPYAMGSYATGYAYLEKALARGLDDPGVRAIAFIIDSGGGEASGCMECAEKIYEARGKKPMRAFAANHAYSAAYWIGAAPGSLTVAKSGGVGSIGVVRAHVSQEKALEKNGLEITLIFAGEHKVDGNSFQKLSKPAKERMQARVDKLYSQFVSTVAKYRGMEDADIRGTKALMYDADEALAIGLADNIGNIEEALALYCREVSNSGEDEMTTPTQAGVTGRKPENGGEDQAAVNAARAEGFQEGQEAAMARINGILACAEAANRPLAAMNLAIKTNIPLDQAQAFLASLPEEKAAPQQPTQQQQQQQQQQPTRAVGAQTQRNHFAEAMQAGGEVDPGAQASEDATAGAGGEPKKGTNLLAVMDMAYGEPKAK